MDRMLIFLPLAALLITACVWDLRHHRIPNWLCLAGLVAGIGIQIAGSSGLLGMLGSIAVPFVVFLPFYLLGGMAAGDVKLLSASGALLGWPAAALAGPLSLIFGAFLGFGYYLARGGLSGMRGAFVRYGSAAKMLFLTGHLLLPEVAADDVAKSRFPYAVAIACGSLASALLVHGVPF